MCFGSPKSGNTTFRIVNPKPILKYIFSCPYSNPAPLGGPRGHVSFTTAVLREHVSFTTVVVQSCDFRARAPEHVSFTTAVLQSCDFQARAPGARFLYYSCTIKLRLSSQSSGSTLCEPALQNLPSRTRTPLIIKIVCRPGILFIRKGGGGRLLLGGRD